MSYKNLANFDSIIAREDFSYICGNKSIGQITEIILYKITQPDGLEKSTYIPLLQQYLKYLTEFYNWLNGQAVPDIRDGYSVCHSVILEAIQLLKLDFYKRQEVLARGRHLKKLNKNFIYGLNSLLSGLRIAFDPDIITATRITKEQLIRYIFDNVEGLGTKYAFNRIGKYSFAGRIREFSRDEVMTIARLLSRLPRNQIDKSPLGWTALGHSYIPVRILLNLRAWRKSQVYLLFKITEHEVYEKWLKTPLGKVSFTAA